MITRNEKYRIEIDNYLGELGLKIYFDKKS